MEGKEHKGKNVDPESNTPEEKREVQNILSGLLNYVFGNPCITQKENPHLRDNYMCCPEPPYESEETFIEEEGKIARNRNEKLILNKQMIVITEEYRGVQWQDKLQGASKNPVRER